MVASLTSESTRSRKLIEKLLLFRMRFIKTISGISLQLIILLVLARQARIEHYSRLENSLKAGDGCEGNSGNFQC